jgi:hypothetical protein
VLRGALFERPGRGDHEIWHSPIAERRFPVDDKILTPLSRHLGIAPRILFGYD